MNKFGADAPPPFLFRAGLSFESACSFLFSHMPQAYSEPVLLVLVGVGPQSGLEIQSTGDSGTQCVSPWSLLTHLSYLVFVHLSNHSCFLPIPSYSDLLIASGMSSAQSSSPWPAFPIYFPMAGSVSSFSPDLNVPC